MNRDKLPIDDTSRPDLDAYFQRIMYAGPREPTLTVLRAIVRQHAQRIAFENIDPWLGRPVSLAGPDLQQKLLHAGRGGYCYEHNGLLSHILQGLGFSVGHLAARVVWKQVTDVPTPRTHMLLCVTIDAQPYLVDVGFGGMTLTDVLRLEVGVIQETPHEPFRLMPAGEELQLEASVRNEWMPLYRFDMQEQLPVDYELANWYVSQHPQSLFVTNLIAARPGAGCRYALRNRQLVTYHRDGQMEHVTLSSVEALRRALEETFLLRLPNDQLLESALTQFFAAEL